MRTLEEIKEEIARCTKELEEYRRKQNEAAAKMWSLSMEQDELYREQAKAISPFKEDNIYSIGGENYKVCYMDCRDGELHVAFMKLTKKGEFCKRGYPKHLYLKVEVLPYLDMDTITTTSKEKILVK